MDEFEKFYNKALRFLSFRPRSEKEVRDNLSKSSFAKASEGQEGKEKVIDKVIYKLKEQKFLNDEEFAKWWIEQRQTHKPRAFWLVKSELKQKGIDINKIQIPETIIQADLEQAKKIVQKKIDKYKNLSRKEIYQKLGSVLARKGFDWEIIKKSIDDSLS